MHLANYFGILEQLLLEIHHQRLICIHAVTCSYISYSIHVTVLCIFTMYMPNCTSFQIIV